LAKRLPFSSCSYNKTASQTLVDTKRVQHRKRLGFKRHGKMEIVTHGRYYEGDWTTIYEMRGVKAVKVLEEGCGA